MKLTIVNDHDPESPREWDNLGTMYCWHRRYELGDEQPSQSPDEWYAENVKPNDIALPLYLYDHSGITMSTGSFSCPWDSGQVGWIHIAAEKIRDEFGWKLITEKRRKKIADILRAEVVTYDSYLRGDVWGFILRDDAGEVVDSCYGFYDDKEGIGHHLPKEALPLLDNAWENRSY